MSERERVALFIGVMLVMAMLLPTVRELLAVARGTPGEADRVDIGPREEQKVRYA